MEKIEVLLAQATINCFKERFNADISGVSLTFNETPKDFVGDLTLVVFPLLRYTKLKPEDSADAVGKYLLENSGIVAAYNVVKGFVNLTISAEFWNQFFAAQIFNTQYGTLAPKKDKILIEYSSPNTNKPLHLGHVRNNVLGIAVSGLMKACGYETYTCNLVNDRGIHICKSMLAWQKTGNGETPQSSGMKGDKLVGKYYVAFENILKEQSEPLIKAAIDENWAPFEGKETPAIQAAVKRFLETTEEEKKEELQGQIKTLVRNVTPIMLEAQEMLRGWESGDEAVVSLWKTMNGWVYEGFDVTYKSLGVSFDKTYYESNTYLLGKEIVQEGLEKGVLYQKEDGSVWIDLTADGLDHKLLLRSDGTSVYMTQDLGTAELRYKDFGAERSIYVVGNEQDYHFKVLKLVLQKLGRSYADGLYHLSYGMVDLPSGKMKSREGTVVDADDLVEEMVSTARQQTEELGKIDDFAEGEAEQLYHTIGLGALKFYLLRVDPRKRILFDPKESIDLQGYTGPFVQYTYARIRSILRRYEQQYGNIQLPETLSWEAEELEVLKKIYQFHDVLEKGGEELNPAKVVDYAYELAKLYNKFYAEHSIFNTEEAAMHKRVALSQFAGDVIRKSFAIVGIQVPERM